MAKDATAMVADARVADATTAGMATAGGAMGPLAGGAPCAPRARRLTRRELCVRAALALGSVVAASAAGVFCAGCTKSDPDGAGEGAGAAGAAGDAKGAAPLAIGTLATEDILPMWVAQHEGLFEGRPEIGPVEIHVFQSATELIAAVSAGQVAIAMTDPMVTASLYASGARVRIEWVTLGTTAAQGRFGIMTADPQVKSLADLAGVPIGVGSNTILEYVMDVLMERAGVPADQVVKAELQKLPVRYEAMASGQVKAAALPGSLLALGEASGFVTVADDTAGENLSQSVMISYTPLFAGQEGQRRLEALRDVWDDAAQKINASPEDYRALLVQKANLPEAIAATYPISEYPLAELPSARMIDPVLDWMVRKGYLEDSLTYDETDGSFARA